MTELQREANRDFTPTIAGIMHTVYDACTAEYGPGSYKRMKEHMMNHVERERHRMFHDATKTVEKHLDEMCKALQESMEAKADEIFVQMNRDYMQALAGRDIQGPILVPGRGEGRLRREVRESLSNVDEQFEEIAQGDLKTKGEDEDGSVVSEQEFASVHDDQGDVDGADDSFMNDADDTMPISDHDGNSGHQTPTNDEVEDGEL